MTTTRLQRVPGTFTITDPDWPTYEVPNITAGLLADFDSHALAVADEITAWPRAGGTHPSLTLNNVSTVAAKRPDAILDPAEGVILRTVAADQHYIRTLPELTTSLVTQPLTIAMRIRANSLPTSGVSCPIASGTGRAMRVEVGASGSVRLGVNTTSPLTAPPGLLAAGEWVNIVAVFNGAQSKIYKNGELRVTGNPGTPSGDAEGRLNGLTVGTTEIFSTYFDGSFRRIRVYGRALSDGDAAALSAAWS